MTTSVCEVVAALGSAISQRIGEPCYKLWFHAHTKFQIGADHIVVGVPNRFFQEWLQNKYADTVQEAAQEILGSARPVRFEIDAELYQAARRKERVAHVDAPSVSTQPVVAEAKRAVHAVGEAPRKTRRWRRLCDFVVGPCNRMAHASAQAVIEAPGESANPLVIHGPVGTGKTHLLEAIHVGLRKGHPEARHTFVTAEEFTNRFLHAMHNGKLSAFRHQFRDSDALLIDDLDFLAGKRATMEEFLHTVDALLANGRQLVVTCDCHPKLTGEFSAELTDRLLGGAVWGLLPPDAETRLQILRGKSSQRDARMPDDVLQLLATELRGNVRELEGALQSVRHYARVTGRPMDVSLAREALGDLMRHAIRVVQLADIDRAVCQALQLQSGALQSTQRSWSISHPRMVAMFLGRKHTAASYSDIGQYFGGRNHSTVVAAEKKVRQWQERNEEMMLGERKLRVREVLELVERALWK